MLWIQQCRSHYHVLGESRSPQPRRQEAWPNSTHGMPRCWTQCQHRDRCTAQSIPGKDGGPAATQDPPDGPQQHAGQHGEAWWHTPAQCVMQALHPICPNH